MSVEDVLDAIVADAPELEGCVVTMRGGLVHNLSWELGSLDLQGLADDATQMLALSDLLKGERGPFEATLVEFDGRSVIARRLEEGMLLCFAPPVQRAGFRNIQDVVDRHAARLDRANTHPAAGQLELVADRGAAPFRPVGPARRMTNAEDLPIAPKGEDHDDQEAPRRLRVTENLFSDI